MKGKKKSSKAAGAMKKLSKAKGGRVGGGKVPTLFGGRIIGGKR